LPSQVAELDLDPRAGAGADHRDTTLQREAFEVRGEVLAADQLEDHVVLAVDIGVRTERTELVVVVPGIGRDPRSCREPELDRRDPDATRGAVYEQALPRRKLSLREEGVVRRCEHLDE